MVDFSKVAFALIEVFAFVEKVELLIYPKK